MDISNEIKHFMSKFLNTNKYKKSIYARDRKFTSTVLKGRMLELFLSSSSTFFPAQDLRRIEPNQENTVTLR